MGVGVDESESVGVVSIAYQERKKGIDFIVGKSDYGMVFQFSSEQNIPMKKRFVYRGCM